MGNKENYTLQVDLDKMPEGWVCFLVGPEQPVIAPPPVRMKLLEIQEAIRWILNDASYKPPEEIGDIAERWISKLRQVAV